LLQVISLRKGDAVQSTSTSISRGHPQY